MAAGSRHQHCRRAHGILPAMADNDVARIVAQALADAREKGLDDVDQTGHAVRAVLAARPDMSASASLRAVNRWRRE